MSGVDAQIARARSTPKSMPVQLSLAQLIFETPTSQGKIINLERAAALLSAAEIPPGGIFSFWALVGEPTAQRGFATGRAIVADEVARDVGGGLCQISGLIYELCLRGGLDVVERHAHSRDLYNDETRFAPLGLDATVGFTFKDLRLRNTLDGPVAFTFDVGKDRIEARLHSDVEIAAQTLDVRIEETTAHRLVSVTRHGAGGVQDISTDRYVIAAS